MSTFKTEAIILTKRPLKDADRLYIMYTKDHGKLEAKVRSAASAKSKLAGQIEPISLSRVMIAKGRGFDTIAGARLIKPFSTDLVDGRPFAALAAELVSKMIKPGVPDGHIYNLLLSYLTAVNGAEYKPGPIRILTLRFIWQFLSLLGYQPDVNGRKFGDLPKLSEPSKKLLSECLEQKSRLTILRTSSTVVKELAVFTQGFLRYFSEGDVRSFNFCFHL
ncbi:DNA repair protein RecO [candidate division WWE3 bacterium CG_4_10_14_0_2_um_filter_41_14]|uniref:DNA repair protein RecO n=1 Tax=candidate division WWE3 bacterium CG_4_10_14_0_2_um_filter_41_14 TaxID=1975072 RepID=A0A2M7TK64_UNCKA|nr:MAG: DNA repair protein RecO [candidate division WWE3 bacterium CG_4_10_14_0_2_um_filter_41_14]